MNLKIKRQWLEALRSGKYLQGKCVLRAFVDGEHRFCCLGVLADLCPIGQWLPSEGVVRPYDAKGIHRSSMPPPAVFTWAEIDGNSEPVDQIVGMNDRGENFTAIADYIEENF